MTQRHSDLVAFASADADGCFSRPVKQTQDKEIIKTDRNPLQSAESILTKPLEKINGQEGNIRKRQAYTKRGGRWDEGL